MRAARVLMFVLLLIAFGVAQTTSAGTAPAASSSSKDPQFPPRRNASQDDEFARMQRDQQKKLNKERHALLKKDTDRLLELATELKMYVDKSNENMLSIDVVKKAEAIEKLAHSVKEKMKGPY